MHQRVTLRAGLFAAVALLLLAYAYLIDANAAGLMFDILGALLLLVPDMSQEAAQERHWSESRYEGDFHLSERKRLPYHERFPLWVARKLGSTNVMAMNADSLEESLTVKFWAVVFLVVGFVLQLFGG